MTKKSVVSFGAKDEKWSLYNDLRLKQSPLAKKLAFPHEGRGHVLLEGDRPKAFLASFFNEDMQNTSPDNAVLGFYEAISMKDGHLLLGHVQEEMKRLGKKVLIGPMNQNTWGQYRFALKPKKTDLHFSPSTFLGDVTHHESYSDHFESFGFSPLSHYETRASFDLKSRHKRRRELEETFTAHGITISSIDMSCFEATLKDLFVLSLEGFSQNKFYTPIDFSYFASLYKGIEAIIDEDFFLLAKDKTGKLIGFIFAYQDPLAIEKRVVLKSMTIAKSVRGIGLGLFLMDEIQRRAHEKNFDLALHALMYSENTTKGISEGALNSIIFKRYTLYQKVV